MTAAKKIQAWEEFSMAGHWPARCDIENYVTNDSVCNATPYTKGNGAAAGINIFVLTDCLTNKRLPMPQQNVRYAQAGVALPQGQDSLTSE